MDKQAFDLVIAVAERSLRSKVSRDAPSTTSGDPPAKKAAPAARDIVDMDSLEGRVADYASFGFGGDRAGRTANMALAAGRRVPISVRHPSTHAAAYRIGGGLAGGLAGLLVGRRFMGDYPGIPAGALVGGLAGSTLAKYLAVHLRRRAMRRVGRDYDRARLRGDLKPVIPTAGLTEARLLPLRGPHRRGQQTAYDMITGNHDNSWLSTGNREAAMYELAPHVIRAHLSHVPGARTLAPYAIGYSQNFSTYEDAQRARERATGQSPSKP